MQPAPRSGHTITTVGKAHFMFGGLDTDKQSKKEGKLLPSNQLWTLKLQGNTCDWRLINCTGDQPLPRACHAACALGAERLLIFGGFYTSQVRLNDTFIFKPATSQWSQPPNQVKSNGEPNNQESKIGAPPPRAYHSATYHENSKKVYVFGGHGGVGFQRTAFNDIFSLDTDTFEWMPLEPAGTPPDGRGGHNANFMANSSKLMIFGGWSFTSQYQNVSIYDTEKNEWIDPEISHEIPKWNLGGIMAASIPSWKYFIFGGSVGSFEEGGNRTNSRFVDDSWVLDVQQLTWNPLQLEAEQGKKPLKPKPRESPGIFYDSNDSRVVIFGGWCNQWLGDMWALNVSSITGPPYAIFGIRPALGPLTGRTKVSITGDGFKDSQNILIKFSVGGGKGDKEVTGVYISQDELQCETPPFDYPRKVEVTVSINKADYTITKSQFTYFLNTRAEKTICYGPGILFENAAGQETIIAIQARNKDDQNRESGSDEFVVTIIRPDKVRKEEDMTQAKPKTNMMMGDDGQEEEQPAEGDEAAENKVEAPPQEIQIIEDLSIVKFNFVDNGNGTYYIKYKLDEAGPVNIDIKFKNENGELQNIRGNPFTASFTEKPMAKTNELTGNLVVNHLQNKLKEIAEFIERTREGIDIKKKNIQNNVQELITVMKDLEEIREKHDEQILCLDTVQETLSFFERNDMRRDAEMKRCHKLQQEWKTLNTISQAVKKDIQQPIKVESDKAAEEIKKFEEITLKEFAQSIKGECFYDYGTGIEKSTQRLEEVLIKVKKKETILRQHEEMAKVFEFPNLVEGSTKSLEAIKFDLGLVKRLWAHIKVCTDRILEFMQMKWGTINSMDMEDEIKKLRKGLTDMKGLDRKSKVYVGINDVLKNWATFLPLVGELKDPSMEVEDERHWKKVKQVVKKEFNVDSTLSLETIWDLKLFDFKEQIEEITDRSKQELKMDKQLNKVIQFWEKVQFELIPHKSTDVKTLKMIDEEFEALEENQQQINNMLLSKYVTYFEKKVEKWKQDLGQVYDVVQLLSEVQKTWSFLENLFIQSEEVKKELPNESQKFEVIDKEMKQIMSNGCQQPNCLKFCTQDRMLHRLESIQAELKVCEKALNDFLDSKRKAFPRFYFVSVNDLLDILSNGNSPAKINRHMSKIFQAIEKLTLIEKGAERPTATEMISCVGIEEVKFTVPLHLEGKVENYLDQIIKTMNKGLKDLANVSFETYAKPDRKSWIKKDPAQITLLVNNIIWSNECEECFKGLQTGKMSVMSDLLAKSIEELKELIITVRGDLDRPLRQKLMCLITLDTHSRDVISKLIDEKVKSAEEFQWQSQLKFYWINNTSMIRIADAKFEYNYEYLGNGPRLVVTPLTDRIYVTATQALHLNMGCAPAGPAGTGKTESTKDLSNALAKACYVFNCSSEMNYESMGNIYKGLAASGCWGCFDEFNRLLPEVLSVCSVQFKAVTDAIKAKVQKFILEGQEINLDPTCGVFITMNPGYLGRAELPEGLKALFRPITVVVPDLELICENMLMAEGFEQAKALAKKFVTLYMLCRDLLSKQLHYDWGLRAIKSVLVVAGGFKRAEPELPEDSILMRALRDFNIPKIAFADLSVFYGLLGDLFPGVDPPRKRDIDFEKIIRDMSIESKLYPEEEFILKVVQLYELLAIRHCVFVMGPPGAGKSVTWKILGKSQDKVGRKTTIVDINPKTVSTKDFYGYNLPSKEWKDGLFSKNLRSLAEVTDTNPKWMILDGDLDANWIESMNSLMDDNKILTLANNERIPLKPHMRAIFEIRDLRFATPATVSRAGILYISDDKGHQWRSYVNSWIEYSLPDTLDKNMKVQLKSFFDRYVPDTLQLLRKSYKFLVQVSQISQVISICKALEPMLEEQVKNLEYVFVYALVWSIGGALAEKDGIDYRKEFSNWWKGAWKTQVRFPSKGTIFDYYVDQSGETSKFSEWAKRIVQIDFDPSAGMTMGNITVPTIETIATSDFIKNFLSSKFPSLMIGNAGCGKTQLANGILKEIVRAKPENYGYQQINFNYYTDSSYLQSQLEQTLEKKAGRQYGPPGRLHMIYFIDDLNMPSLDPYDTQTAIELLRQHADYGHWYDISKLSLKDIINTQVIAAMNPSAGSFQVNPRYQRHFWTISIQFPSNESLMLIYLTFLNGHLKKFKMPVQEYAPLIVRASLLLHQSVSAQFKKTAINFHYEFNLRHLSNIFMGLLLSDYQKYTEPDKIVKLWVHECERTYGDRLVSLEHLKIFKDMVFDIVKKQFNRINLTRYFSGQAPENLIYCNFINGIQNERFYDQMPNDKLDFFIKDSLEEYNNNNVQMNLVLFEDALKHVCRICRIILPPSGHALLVGVGGSGKQSLAKLSSFIMSMTVFQITISASYGMNDLRTDLQNLYDKCGPREEGILFLFTEGQITNERFLVYINDLLSSGEIAELYTQDEKELMINKVRPKAKAEKGSDSRESCWSWFIDTVKKNLHMTICFSPVGDMRRRARQFPALVNCTVIDWFQPWPKEALYGVAKSFLEQVELGQPAIQEAVIKFMPFSFEKVNELGVKLLEQERRYAYTTPKSFLELIKLFTNMLNNKKNLLLQNKERYENGLQKLKQTSEQVEVIKIEVEQKQKEAEVLKKSADEFAEVVGTEKAKVEIENQKAKIEQDNCGQIKVDVEQRKIATQKELDDAIPLVEQAKEALNSIQKKDFQTAKSFTSPPAGVPEVFAATCYLLAGFFPDAIEIDKNKKPKAVDWKNCLKLMKNPDEFLNKLLSFKDTVDQNLVPSTNVQIVKQQYLSLPTFNGEVMAAKSAAAKGVCEWVINIVKYYDVIQNIDPLRKDLAQSIENLQKATEKLNIVEAQVKELNDKLSVLTAQFNQAQSEKEAAINEANRCAKRLDLATRLVNALSSENVRWARSIEVLDQQLELIVGDVLLASSFVSYCGPFNKKFRTIMINEYFMKFLKDANIPMSPDPNPVKILTSESIAALWNKQLLPSDQVSVENGTILTNSERYPLMIDPQLQGITWIKEKEKSNNLKSLRLGSKNINRDLELSIEQGYSALIENMDERIDAILMPVISRSFIIRSRKKILKFAGKDLELNEKFKLFLHTKLSNPHYPPEIQAEAALINFTVTEAGLGDQLLSLVVKRERPELAALKVELINQQNDFKIKLKDLEDELLFKLSNAKGDILDDIALIENLEYSKKLSVEIEEKVKIAKTTEARINETSENYRDAASRGALFYFLLSDLPKIHSFYRYSLESFIIVINRAIDKISENPMYSKDTMEKYTDGDSQPEPKKEEIKKPEKKKSEEKKEGDEKKEGEEGQDAEKKEDEEVAEKEKEKEKEKEEEEDDPRALKQRVQELINSITLTSFNYTRRGTFERHKLIVSTMLTLRILLRDGKLSQSEVDHLIIGKVDLNPTPMPDSLKSLINENIWAACKVLDTISALQGFTQSLETESLQWKRWYGEEKAELAELPKAFKDLSKFHRLLLLRAIRPDRLPSALNSFVEEQMGTEYVEQPAFNVFETFEESTKSIPLFFVLFPGVDPTPDVEKVANTYDIRSTNKRFINISMGQGQEMRAKEAIFECAKKGYWIMLQNVHLMQSWLYGLNGLEGFLEQVNNDPNTKKNFRVFISSEPPPLPMMQIIPESILQGALKVSNEAPQYLKANFRRAYAKFNQPFLDKSDKKPVEFKACLFALCFFHSVMLGRKKFGSQGWSRVYNFNDGDLTICADVLFNYLSKYDQVPWDDLRYIFGEIMYGGHITDDWDRRTNRTYLKVHLKPEILQPNYTIVPLFKNPDPVKFDYEQYKKYIEEKLPIESPILFGMHPNAEIGYLTESTNTLFSTVMEVQGGASSGGGSKKDDGVMTLLNDLKARAPVDYNIIAIEEKIGDRTPFIVVCLQECERMNELLTEIKVSLENLRLGLTGALNITEAMEFLQTSLQFNKVPASWEKMAYFSRKSLAMWFQDLIERNIQLQNWVQELKTPYSLCISYLFNPMSFLTAVMQYTARDQKLPLDYMAIQTNVTTKKGSEEVVGPADNGAFIHGLYLEGAAWELGGTEQEGYLTEQKPKELHPKLPVINVIAVPLSKKKIRGQYICPVYVTSGRGPTFVFSANLNMESEDSDDSKWILSGTCILMSDD